MAAIYVDAEIWQDLNLTTQDGTNKNLVGQILGSGKQVTIHLGNNDWNCAVFNISFCRELAHKVSFTIYLSNLVEDWTTDNLDNK